MAYPNDLVRTKDWGTEILTDSDLEGQLDLIINWIMAAMDFTTGHDHSTANKGKPVLTAGIADDAVTFPKIDDDGDFGPFTGDWSFSEIAFVEGAAPSTDAGEGKIYTKDSGGQPEMFYREESEGDEVQMTKDGHGLGKIIQVVNTITGAVNSGATIMPHDDTIPQITEGDQYMTLAITPNNTSNLLKIEVVLNFAHSVGDRQVTALFQDATAGALAAAAKHKIADSDSQVIFTHWMAAGTVAETTFRVRSGLAVAGTTTFNGLSTTRRLGGVMASSITITEIQA